MHNRIVTYSLLAFINDNSSKGANFENIFIPLVKRGLSKMCATGIRNGSDISEISQFVETSCGLDMPIPVLKRILDKITLELNSGKAELLRFYGDGSFMIKEYVFDEYEEEITKRREEIERLENYYLDYLKAEGIEEKSSIFDFVDENKFSLGKYIHKKYPTENKSNVEAAKFVNFIRSIKELYNTLQSIYLGSIISAYLEFEPTKIDTKIELVLDTNFIISLLDLNTSSSTENCKRLIEISRKLGYKFTVLAITLQEIDQLLRVRVDNFDSSFLPKQVDPEDIYNACERRGLTKTDLDHIRIHFVTEIESYGIVVVPNVDKYENRAKYSNEFEKLKNRRNTSFAALHDATCIEYVKEKRVKPIYHFDKVNCWLLNNSSSRASYYSTGIQPYSIKAEDLLCLLWLTSPMVKENLNSGEFASIGLSRLVSATLDDSLPSSAALRRLDDNLNKYAKNVITDEDIVNVAKSIAGRTLENLDELNAQGESDQKKFVETLQNIAKSQKKREEEYKKLFDKLITDTKRKSRYLHEQTKLIVEEGKEKEKQLQAEKSKYQDVVDTNTSLLEQIERIEGQNIKLKEKITSPKVKKFVSKKIFYWRLRAFLLVLVGPILLGLYLRNLNNGSLKFDQHFIDSFKSDFLLSGILSLATLIYSGIFVTIFAGRFHQTNINAFKNNIEIPEEIKAAD